jgi:hypothetical protein
MIQQQPGEEPDEQPAAASVSRAAAVTVSAVALVVCVIWVRSLAIWITPLLALAFINEAWRRRAALRASREARRLPR